MRFVPFLFLGWIRIVCRNCHSTLILKSVGERFWRTLATGAVIAAALWFFIDYSWRMLGERGTLILFTAIMVVTLCVAMYYAWKDSRFELSSHS